MCILIAKPSSSRPRLRESDLAGAARIPPPRPDLLALSRPEPSPYVRSRWAPLTRGVFLSRNGARNREARGRRRGARPPAMASAVVLAGRLVLPWGKSEPSDRHPKVPNRTYPFGRHLVKETLEKFRLNPQSLAHFQRYAFEFGKRIFRRFESNYVFSSLQKCHWFCFAHKIFILTTFLSIQIPLDSYLRSLHVRIISLLFWNLLISWYYLINYFL